MSNYTLNTPLRNYFFYKSPDNKVGAPLIDGYLIFESADDHTISLTVYSDVSDPNNPVPYATTPILSNQLAVQLDGDGGIAPIYLQDKAYFILCYSRELELQWTIESYEGALFIPNQNVVDGLVNNLVLDGQFTFGQSYSGDLPSGTPVNLGYPNWYFEKDGTGGTDALTFVPFVLGEDSVPQTPINALLYNMTVAESAGTYKKIYFPIQYVRSLEQQEVTVSFWSKSSTFSVVTLFYEQNFGTGGSPSAPIIVQPNSFSLDGTWTQYSATFTFDSIAGEILGDNGDDVLQIGIMLPVNALVNFWLTNFLVAEGDVSPAYPYLIPQQVEAQVPQNSADYVAAGNYYADKGTIANSVYIATAPQNPQFSNPSQLYSGATIKFFPEYTNTGASTLTFLGETLPIVNSLGTAVTLPLSPGQIIGNSVKYSIGWELQFNTDNIGVRQWFLTHVPTSYTPVVIQKVVTFSNAAQSATGAYNTTPTSNPGSFAVQTFTPRSVNSQINFTFKSGIGTGNTTTILYGISVNNTFIGGGGGAGDGSPSPLGCSASYVNTTGTPISVGVYYGKYAGSALVSLSTAAGTGIIPSCSLTIEEII